MFTQFKKELDKELISFVRYIDRRYRMHTISPLLLATMKNFILREGKRVRPILFIISYKGFSGKKFKHLYRSALSLELLHDFLLVHDDIVDNSDMRRGKPSMHRLFDKTIKKSKHTSFSGKDLAMIVGDIMFAIAIESFLSIEENPLRKEKALLKFVESACYTGCGEFIEFLHSAEDIGQISKSTIYKIYDYKTAHYTFAAPLMTGAILAGAPQEEIDKLFQYGINLGRAFQIKDDILGIFGDQKKTGKSSVTDLQENKKTLPLWHAYNHATQYQKAGLQNILKKKKLTAKDLNFAREIIKATGSLSYARHAIKTLLKKSIRILKTSRIKPLCKNELINYSMGILQI